MPPKAYEPTELEVVLEAQRAEDIAWADLGLDLNQMQIMGRELFAATLKIESALNILIDKGFVTAEELQLSFHKLHVERMATIREGVEPQIRRAKMGLAPKPTVLGPDGQPLSV